MHKEVDRGRKCGKGNGASQCGGWARIAGQDASCNEASRYGIGHVTLGPILYEMTAVSPSSENARGTYAPDGRPE